MADTQESIVEETKNKWTESGLPYEEIREGDNVYLLPLRLERGDLWRTGTAFKVGRDGTTNWVVTGWEGGKSSFNDCRNKKEE